MTDELLDLGPRRAPLVGGLAGRVARRLSQHRPSPGVVRSVLGSLTGVAALVLAGSIAFAPTVIDGHGTAHVPPRTKAFQPLKGDILE